MRPPFAARLAWREAGATTRRLGVYATSIALGVAALVAINSFRAGAIEAARADAARLLGADLRVSSNRAFPDSVRLVLDSAAAAGVPVADVTGTLSVALAPATDRTRLVQLRAVDPGYPWYGEMATDPQGLWPALEASGDALVERVVLDALEVGVGDSLRLGEASFRIAGVLVNPPPELGFRSAVGPRVYIAARRLAEAGLVRFGSLTEHESYLAIPDAAELERFVDRNHDLFRRLSVRIRTAEEQAEDLAEALGVLGRFLGLVGLAALLLGGLGVAGAVHVFVREKRPAIAMLRCIGATQRVAFSAYLLQAGLLGLLGAAAGASAGVAIQAVLPVVIGPLIPFEVRFALRWAPILAGLGIGAGVATVFSLLPLLEIRGVSPLRALRVDVEPPRRRFDPWYMAAWLLIAATVVAVCIAQAGMLLPGLAFAAGLLGALLVLRMAAALLMRLLRQWFPRRAPFDIRQGVSNLFRPGNQTATVVVTLGFAVFILASIWLVQRSMLRWLGPAGSADAPALVAFDIQSDQRAAVLALVDDAGARSQEVVPLVPARVHAINGTPVDEILGGPGAREVEPWALRREYRHTWRMGLSASERLIDGTWWDEAPAAPRGYARISVESDLAEALNVGVGDSITWDVQGVRIPSVISSLRAVEWGQFRTNFFVVFEPGPLDAAPHTWVALIDAPDAAARAALQSTIARAHPNVSVIDVSTMQATVASIIARVASAIRFVAGFSLGAGGLVLVGAVATSRFQRARESALLRALGARRRQVRRMLLTEYLVLGALAGVSGLLLAVLASWGVVVLFLDLPYAVPVGWLVAAWAAVALLAGAAGMASSREALHDTPLGALRAAPG
ncbi:MAG TPA: FtsX-like permease family protein [Methylomirabilota bacterium]|nr:FtsX-like permease family protein [Methylomirabilota bacterium]